MNNKTIKQENEPIMNEKITKISGSQVEELENMITEYSNQMKEGLIKPVLVKYFKLEGYTPSEFFLVSKSGAGIFQGIMYYKSISASGINKPLHKYFHGCFNPKSDDPNVNNYSEMNLSNIVHKSNLRRNKSIAKIVLIESFLQNKGIGRMLVESLKQDSNFAAIVLYPMKETVLFYENLGFVKSDVCADAVDNTPLMVYENSVKSK